MDSARGLGHSCASIYKPLLGLEKDQRAAAIEQIMQMLEQAGDV